jgi:hypothetical protein
MARRIRFDQYDAAARTMVEQHHDEIALILAAEGPSSYNTLLSALAYRCARDSLGFIDTAAGIIVG